MTLPVKIKAAGFNAYVISDPSSKLVYASAAVRGGNYNDLGDNKAGINHLFEHILLNAWRKCNGKSCELFWKTRPVEYNAYTSSYSVIYYINGLKTETENIINFITQIISEPKFSASILENEKKAVLSELTILLNQPTHELVQELYSHIYSDRSGLRNQTNIQLQIDNLKRITISDMIAYHQRFYNSKNITFFFSGNISHATVSGILNTNMATLNRPHQLKMHASIKFDPEKVLLREFITASTTTAATAATAARSVTTHHGTGRAPLFVENKQAKNTEFALMFPVKQVRGSDHVKNIYHLTLCTDIIGVELLSLLRTRHKLVYGVSVVGYISMHGNMLVVNGSCADNHVMRIFDMCIKYILDRHKHDVSDKILSAQKGVAALAEYGKNRTAVDLMRFYQSFFGTYTIMNGDEPADELVVPFITPVQQLQFIETASLADIRREFQRIDVTKVVYGYIGKSKQH
jgi:secreted Zn-dependent insulinase-like peptidase